MNVVLLEWLTSGGFSFGDDCTDFDEEMLAMGTEMVLAVAADLAEFSDVDLIWDERLAEPGFDCGNACSKPKREIRLRKIADRAMVLGTLLQLAEQADAILVIAPETDGCLTQTITCLDHCEYKLVSPAREFATLASDKNLLARELKARGFSQVPNGLVLSSFLEEPLNKSSVSFPAVVKPSDGAGSERVAFVEDRNQLLGLFSELTEQNEPENYRVEQFVDGDAVSVSVIGNPNCFSRVEFVANQEFEAQQNRGSDSSLVLKPLRQMFDREPFGEYLKSVDDLNGEQIARAQDLVERLMQYLPATAGYFGVDMVLSVDGPDFDKVIEVNPRLTMSYLELRKIHAGNLAFEMVKRAGIF